MIFQKGTFFYVGIKIYDVYLWLFVASFLIWKSIFWLDRNGRRNNLYQWYIDINKQGIVFLKSSYEPFIKIASIKVFFMWLSMLISWIFLVLFLDFFINVHLWRVISGFIGLLYQLIRAKLLNIFFKNKFMLTKVC